MKTRERLERIKGTSQWYERMLLATDSVPGTKFDTVIECLTGCLKQLREMRDRGDASPCFRQSYVGATGVDLAGMNAHSLQSFGEELTQAIITGNSALFRDWADAVDAWHAHQPYPDKLRCAILSFCIPPNEIFAMRSIIAHLVSIGLAKKAHKSEEHDDLRRQVRRICSDLELKIKGESGRPKLGHKRSAKGKSKS